MESLLMKHLLNRQTLMVSIKSQLNRNTLVARNLYSTEKKKTEKLNEIAAEVDDVAAHGHGIKSQKSIKVAIIGAPNAGKSSFINTITNHRICPISRRVHTTLTQSTNIRNNDNTQMILYDTPGLTTVKENKKYNLGDKFLRETNGCMENADLIAVIHDVANSYTRNILHPTILEALITYKTVPSILIMNKVDMIRAKRVLLNLVDVLTEGTLMCKQYRYMPWRGREDKFAADMKRPVKYKSDKSAGWPYFSDVFMVSALNGDGFNRVASYISAQSIERPWQFPDYQFTDQRAEDLILNNVRAVMLDFLPQEIPYELNCEMELFEVKHKRINAYVNIHAKNPRIERVICGIDNQRLNQISEVVASNIIQLYNLNVQIVLNVVSKSKPYKPRPLNAQFSRTKPLNGAEEWVRPMVRGNETKVK